MSKPSKHLADQLAAAVAPISGETAPTKAVAKTLRQLAKQLTKQRGKQAKAAQEPMPLPAKQARKALAGELATALQPYLESTEALDAKFPKGVVKAVKRLAAQLVKARRKQAKQTVKQAKLTTKQVVKDSQPDETAHAGTTPAAKVTRKPASGPSAPLKTRRPAGTLKRATPSAAAPTPTEADNT